MLPSFRLAIEDLATRVPKARTRFAPAPTGFLHLGHVVNAIFVWGLARAAHGVVVLRIEDHDRQRSRPQFDKQLLEDVAWLGFEPDEGTDRDGDPRLRQSDRDTHYLAALEPLIAAGQVYGCRCSRAEVVAAGGATGRYPGTCRHRELPLTDRVGWRVRLDPEAVAFDDLLLGAQQQSCDQHGGDVLVRDRYGNWTYQWAVVVDDLLQGITLVVRGLDLLPSTGRQIGLARLIGRDRPPVFAHHALVMKSSNQKLSKSDRDTGVCDLRAAGWTPAQVIGHAAWRAALQPTDTPLAADEAASVFRV